VYGVRCTVYGVQCTVYGVRCTVYGVRCRISGKGNLSMCSGVENATQKGRSRTKGFRAHSRCKAQGIGFVVKGYRFQG
jgi:hypothetical protein